MKSWKRERQLALSFPRPSEWLRKHPLQAGSSLGAGPWPWSSLEGSRRVDVIGPSATRLPASVSRATVIQTWPSYLGGKTRGQNRTVQTKRRWRSPPGRTSDSTTTTEVQSWMSSKNCPPRRASSITVTPNMECLTVRPRRDFLDDSRSGDRLPKRDERWASKRSNPRIDDHRRNSFRRSHVRPTEWSDGTNPQDGEAESDTGHACLVPCRSSSLFCTHRHVANPTNLGRAELLWSLGPSDVFSRLTPMQRRRSPTPPKISFFADPATTLVWSFAPIKRDRSNRRPLAVEPAVVSPFYSRDADFKIFRLPINPLGRRVSSINAKINRSAEIPDPGRNGVLRKPDVWPPSLGFVHPEIREPSRDRPRMKRPELFDDRPDGRFNGLSNRPHLDRQFPCGTTKRDGDCSAPIEWERQPRDVYGSTDPPHRPHWQTINESPDRNRILRIARRFIAESSPNTLVPPFEHPRCREQQHRRRLAVFPRTPDRYEFCFENAEYPCDGSDRNGGDPREYWSLKTIGAIDCPLGFSKPILRKPNRCTDVVFLGENGSLRIKRDENPTVSTSGLSGSGVRLTRKTLLPCLAIDNIETPNGMTHAGSIASQSSDRRVSYACIAESMSLKL